MHRLLRQWFVLGLLLAPAERGSAWDDVPPPLDAERVAGGILSCRRESASLQNENACGEAEGPVYVALRRGGAKLAQAWHEGPDRRRGIVEAIKAAVAQTNARPDAIELCLAHSFRRADPRTDQHALAEVHRGIRGIEVRRGASLVRYAPTEMIGRNIGFEHAIAESNATGSPDAVDVRLFDADQFLVTLGEPVRIVRMYRGNTLVPPEAVTATNVGALADGMKDWMLRQVHEDGRLTYKYWPSRGEESLSNNLIRQFMGTVCLGMIARAEEGGYPAELMDRNLRYNIAHFYRKDGGLGYVEYGDKATLGAAAIAAVAIITHPLRHAYRDQEVGLRAFVDHMWRPDGSFRTFYRPAERDGDNQNFYPGEALLMWAMVMRDEPAEALLGRFMTSVRYYRRWHLQNRNPAFIPWHTQACYAAWKRTQDPFLASWIFEMNDWLLHIQQWNDVPYPDLRGRFYHPSGRYGPPHASSTGAYLEGLADAFALARELGDAGRVVAYRRAILRGLRSALQLQFSDEVDLFYVSQRERVRGALRTTEYNNEIRIDNVQHMLMAVYKVMALFRPEDYRSSPGQP